MLLWKVKCIAAYLRKQQTCTSCVAIARPTLHRLPQDDVPACTEAEETCHRREGSRRGRIVSMERGNLHTYRYIHLDLEPQRTAGRVRYCRLGTSTISPAELIDDVRRSSSPVLLHLLRETTDDRGGRQRDPIAVSDSR